MSDFVPLVLIAAIMFVYSITLTNAQLIKSSISSFDADKDQFRYELVQSQLLMDCNDCKVPGVLNTDKVIEWDDLKVYKQ